MTAKKALRVRRVRYDFNADDVPFIWQPERPAFSIHTNYMSFLAPGFESMIVDVTRQAIPLMRDPAAVHEANLFLRQEAQHTAAHVRHVNALIRRYPGLQETMDELYTSYRHLTTTKTVVWRLAYTAVLESTFTPFFKVYLDHEDKLFRPGDERVASLFLWHFAEEIEHRGSAMVVYKAVNQSFLYRLRAMGSVLRHIGDTISIVHRGFQKHVPAEDGGHYGAVLPDGLSFRALRNVKRARIALNQKPEQSAYAGIPRREIAKMIMGLTRCQAPNHDSTSEDIPTFANRFFDRYEEEPRCALRWYSAGPTEVEDEFGESR
ncbi:metal-dependent hydrolase [Mycobacterium sp. E2479]|uniref:metal-dependent hydrolase n=1 Tax=Mycobacterium sp. E2479 TaxID=1834134 RepID=UPI0007FCDA9B|nr:metal-dependent hydrolase [Mycobacterium sp. E2479]OBH49250.1 metal-dependent hydrolase [Mycobacterium sp. E2479]